MDGLVQLMTGFGLATGAGGRASLVALGLGVFHHTEYFELGNDYLWLASIPVMFVLGVVAIAEIWIDSHPDLKDFAHYPTYLSSFIVGFIALSASTGTVDSNLLILGGSGVLGGVTSTGVRYVRNEITTFIEDSTEAFNGALGDGKTTSGRSWIENGGTVGLTAVAIVAPYIAGAVCILLFVGGLYWMAKRRKDPVLDSL
jgi:hypothetical protein